MVVLYDVNGHILASVTTDSHILTAAFAEVREWFDGSCVVTGHVDGMIRVFSVEFWDESSKATLTDALDAIPATTDDPNSVEAFLKASLAVSPYMLRSKAALDYHQTPVTALHVTS